MNNEKIYSENEIDAALGEDLENWEFVAGHICREYKVNGWKSALLLTQAIGHLAELAWHHPDIELSYGSVKVKLMTHSVGGITDKDFELAKRIEQCVGWKPGNDQDVSLTGTPDDERYQYIKD